MIIGKGSLFDQKVSAICLLTNGYYTFGNEAILGKGHASEAGNKWKILSKKLGYMNSLHGTHVFIILKRSKKNERPYSVVSFPVRPKSAKVRIKGKNVIRSMRGRYPVGEFVPGYVLRCDLELIAQSARELVELADAQGWKSVAIPKPAVGEFSWVKIRNIVKPILKGKRFILMDLEEEQ